MPQPLYKPGRSVYLVQKSKGRAEQAMGDSGKRKPLVADKRYGKAAATPPAPPKKRSPRKKRASKPVRGGLLWLPVRLVQFLFRLIWAMTWRVGLITALILGAMVWYTSTSLPSVDRLLDGRARGSVTMLDTYGQVFAVRGAQFGGAVTAESVSPHLKNAVIATEDKRFYRHFGLSPLGIISAIRINIREGRHPLKGHGGSTITQQTAKLMCLGVEYDARQWKSERDYEEDCRRSTLARKAKEAIFAMAMELKYTKNEILSIYLNRAYMGGGAYGAEAAAQRFFGKPAAAVNPSEAAILAGLLTAPTTLAPTTNLERSQNRAAVVIGLMRDQGYLNPQEASFALAHPATLSESAEQAAGGYFADWLMSSGPEFLTRNTAEDVVIRTTLDPRVQRAAEEAVTEIFNTRLKEGSKAEAAIVVMSADGAVRAMVGGRQTKVVGAFNRATQALRQTGSAFKPFVYAAALDMGYSGNDVIEDAPLTIDIPGSGPWSPSNYDRKFHGFVTMTEALRQSLNIPAVKVAQAAGLERVRAVASGFGVGDELADGPALALGASESTLIKMTGAYAGLLNGGSSVSPYGLLSLRIKSDSAPLMEQESGIGERVISEEAAQELIWMMHQVVNGGTGARANLPDREVAGKTGTTQAARDAWFMGFSANYVAGVWMGYDDNTPLSGVTGGGLPAEIWHSVMVRAHEGIPPMPLPMREPGAGQRMADQDDFAAGGGGEGLIEGLLRGIFGGASSNAGGTTGGVRLPPATNDTRPFVPTREDR